VVALRKQCAFVAAKSGLFGLTRAMAAELGQYGIRVNAIAPGSITNADWSKVAGDEAAKSLLSHIPLGRQGSAEEVANAVAFLASPEASYITGALLTVDGGWTCGFMRDW
jgi:3-oxoacyl-[acyl-carrier protein] reductase